MYQVQPHNYDNLHMFNFMYLDKENQRQFACVSGFSLDEALANVKVELPSFANFHLVGMYKIKDVVEKALGVSPLPLPSFYDTLASQLAPIMTVTTNLEGVEQKIKANELEVESKKKELDEQIAKVNLMISEAEKRADVLKKDLNRKQNIRFLKVIKDTVGDVKISMAIKKLSL